ncbi:hypothetical protein [Cecembia rubra]|uniref:Methyltransferase family protein n=1 Tax=Cecembia rubra TaxID=1485585 RepID=A0A2P8DVK2_9BACT|nr:hypothetical protein [Cecembia rubra]PSL01263.1 hypothetical protein CLV48_11465 [Cecembia rubra]
MKLVNLRDWVFGIQKTGFLIQEKVKEIVWFRTKELKAIEILKPYFPKGFLFESEFSLSFQTIQHIANDIVIHRPKTILEIGSGLSTMILNNLIKELDYRPEFISLDQDENWQKHLLNYCDLVTFKNFEISEKNEYSKKGKGKWFDIPNDSDLLNYNFDLVIIDGPKGFESRFARYGILNFLKGKISKSSIIFLDDTNRNDEKFLLNSMRDQLGFTHCKSFYKYSRLSFQDGINTTPS